MHYFYTGFATEKFTTKKYPDATAQFTTIGYDATIIPHSGYECKDFVCSEGNYLGEESFTSLKSDLLDGTFPWRKCSVKALVCYLTQIFQYLIFQDVNV